MVEEDVGDREQCGRITSRNGQKYHIMTVSEWHKIENDGDPWQPTCWLQMAHNDDDLHSMIASSLPPRSLWSQGNHFSVPCKLQLSVIFPYHRIAAFPVLHVHLENLSYNIVVYMPYSPTLFFQLGKVKYHKSHHFEYSNDVPILGDTKPGIGGDMLPGQRREPRNSAIPRGNGPDLPAWVAFDRQVLCFDANFKEAVHEKREEQFRVRHCKIYFYLEDDSIQVTEPRLKNSGIPQGLSIHLQLMESQFFGYFSVCCKNSLFQLMFCMCWIEQSCAEPMILKVHIVKVITWLA